MSHCKYPRQLGVNSISPSVWIILLLITFQIQAPGSDHSYELEETRTFEQFAISPAASEETGFSQSLQTVPDSVTELKNEIAGLSALIEEEGRLIDRLDALYQVTYPIGITKNIGGQNYTIVLDSDEITPEGAFINAYMSFPIPQTGRQLAFAANRIPLSAQGGINGTVELALLSDEPINMGDDSRLIVYGRDESGNYHTKVRFDCNGFVDMVLDAGIEFAKSAFVCEDPATGAQKPSEPVTCQFITTIQSWNDLMVEVSLPPFQITQLKGFGFEVQQAVFDFSDLSNPTGAVFPENYAGIEVFGDLPELWRGFYFRQVTLRLPPELKDGERMAILAQNLVIDELGFSGRFIAENLFELGDASLGGWA